MQEGKYLVRSESWSHAMPSVEPPGCEPQMDALQMGSEKNLHCVVVVQHPLCLSSLASVLVSPLGLVP